MKDIIIALLSKGEKFLNSTVYFVNLSKLTMEQAIQMAEEIGNKEFTKRLKESYGVN